MNIKSHIVHNAAIVLLLGLSIAVLAQQVDANREHYKEKKRWHKRAMREDHPHWLMIWRQNFHLPYVIALEQIQKSPHSKFWLIGVDLDVMMVINYFAYPKELRSSVETQIELERQHYSENYQHFEHKPPKEYDEVIRTHREDQIF